MLVLQLTNQHENVAHMYMASALLKHCLDSDVKHS